jgi:hypothetical protein
MLDVTVTGVNTSKVALATLPVDAPFLIRRRIFESTRRHLCAVTVISMWAPGAVSLDIPTVVRAGLGSGKKVMYTAFMRGKRLKSVR